jgi:hypothetical protein
MALNVGLKPDLLCGLAGRSGFIPTLAVVRCRVETRPTTRSRGCYLVGVLSMNLCFLGDSTCRRMKN